MAEPLLEQHIAAPTGAGHGFGRETAPLLAGRGDRTVPTDIRAATIAAMPTSVFAEPSDAAGAAVEANA